MMVVAPENNLELAVAVRVGYDGGPCTTRAVLCGSRP
jgi:hypothetical protein